MKELNGVTVMPQSFYAVIEGGKAVMLPAEDGQWLNKTAVAESFLTLAQERDSWKQRAEAAESNYANEHDARKQVERNYELLEAKLAELENQEPYAYAYRFKGRQGLSFRKLDIDKCDSKIMPLFTRPVPAINLAEMGESRKVFQCSACGCEGLYEPPESECHCLGDGAHWIESELFTRPAPAINLAELVPDEMPNGGSGSPTDSVTHWCDGYNSCRAAILRKIEEQSQ